MTFFTLLEPSEQHLPFFMRGLTDLLLAVYDCEPHLIDAGTEPLLRLIAARSTGCRSECCGKCAGDLHVELYVSEHFTLKPFEVRLIIADTLNLPGHPWAQVAIVWDSHVRNSPAAQDAPPSSRNLAEIRSLFSRRLPSTEFLFGELLELKDPYDNRHLFTPWLEHIKADNGGEYPSYPRRTFDLAVDRCLARMKKEGKLKPKPPADMAAD